MTRYTITGEGASPRCFRLVEDKHGAWMQTAEVDALIKDIELACNREFRRSADTDAFVIELRGILSRAQK